MTTRRNLWLAVTGLASIAMVAAFTLWTAQRADHEMRRDLIREARLVAPAIDVEEVAAFRGTAADTLSPAYSRLKERLVRARRAKPDCRFLYLLGRRENGDIFFYLDSEPAESRDYSPPGQVYHEAPPAARSAFSENRAYTTGPYIDRWGTWTSAFLPLESAQGGRAAAVLGMDVDAAAWNWNVLRRSALPASLGVIAFALVMIIIILVESRTVIRRHERMLIDSEKRYRAFINSTADMAFLKDEEFRYTIVNNHLADYFGRRREEIIGLSDYDLMPGEAADNCRKSDLEALSSDGIAVNEEIVGDRIFETTKFPAAIGTTRVVGGFIRDITERTRAKDALNAALEEKEALLRELQHRVKNSLFMISSMAELEAARSGDPAVRKALESLGGRIHTLSELYTMLYRSQDTRQIPLDRYCKSIGDSLYAAHTDADGRMTLQYRIDPVTVDTKRASVVGLILNELLMNALKYAFPGDRAGTITVSLKAASGDLTLKVADNGVGMPGGSGPDHPGGLGLELVKLLARQMGGALDIRSEGGTIVTVSFSGRENGEERPQTGTTAN
ncbi:MAG: PAS domain-containing protein [Spirochaetes bacterium]|nr:PAS domain-containing protein [Spirochaetota bacterium]